MNEMLQVLVKRVGNLFSVKSIVTISLTIAFVISIIAFYFGSQNAKEIKNDATD